MRNDDNIKDWRSTGRRKARAELFRSYTPFQCADCGKTTKIPPQDAPTWFEEIWSSENRVLDSQLQADHETKDTSQNSIEDLAWRCPSCHKKKDMQTTKGVATKEVKLM